MTYYLWLKAAHIIFVIFWCAGLLMLPRFFAYHVTSKVGSKEDKEWQKREARLLRIIMNPSLILVWFFGVLLVLEMGVLFEGWFLAKAAVVLFLTIFHMVMARWRKDFVAGLRNKEEKFYRVINEIPSLCIILIVLLVVLKPFS